MATIKNYCSVCMGYTHHSVLFKKETGNGRDEDFNWSEEFMIVECMGCDKVSFRKEYYDEDSYDYEIEEMIKDVSIYPLVLKNSKPLGYTYLLPFHVKIAYEESINALKSDCKLLAAAGFRAVIEAVCKDKSLKGKDIKTKIGNLYSKGFLSKTEADRLHAVRFLGNDSIHEIEIPKEEQLKGALDVIEHLLKSLYLIDKTSSRGMDTVIRNYSDFEDLIDMQLGDFKVGEETVLKRILGKSIRRIPTELFQNFEEKLIANITNGDYTNLSLGSKVPQKGKDKKITDIQKYSILDKKMRRPF